MKIIVNIFKRLSSSFGIALIMSMDFMISFKNNSNGLFQSIKVLSNKTWVALNQEWDGLIISIQSYNVYAEMIGEIIKSHVVL